MRAALVVLCLVATSASTAHAGPDQPWYREPYGANRVVHLLIATSLTALYPAFGWAERASAPEVCRWCDPTALDRATRDALRWSDVGRAGTLSDAAAYVVTPGVSVTLVLFGTLEDPTAAALIDDLVPILEAGAITRWLSRGAKLAIGRQRPYAHYDHAEDEDDNLSFPSGHTSTAFSIATSAAMVAHMRGYKSEPYLWIAGLTVASATGYLRIAADRHYLTDVLAGAVLGAGVGLTVPLLMRRNVEVMPSGRGVAIRGTW